MTKITSIRRFNFAPKRSQAAYTKKSLYARLLLVLLMEIQRFKIQIRAAISTNFGALTRRSYVVCHE
jgi:hypothetical protein